jgi:dTDP-4-amino-4,6-dideoxygalactose transaminase
LYLNNGTIALQIAIKALALKGEIITTPFSYVATTSSIAWENCKPVFVDIVPNTFNIDPAKIEAAITEKTSAIIATHVYGNPCDIDAIQKIADKYKLKTIYDGAHCFGSMYKGKSVFAYGDICTTSFHATKLFHTIEGGAVFTSDPEVLKKMSLMRNFGHHDSAEHFAEIGINAKNSEFHAAMGLANLKYISDLLRSRKEQSLRYDHWLKVLEAPRLMIDSNVEFNYAYYPLILKNEELVLKVIKALEGNLIYPRRYFYPSLNAVKIYKGDSLPVSEALVQRVVCLPLYNSLSSEEIDFVCRIILRACNY